MQIICGQDRPPTMKLVNRDSSGCSQKQQTSISRREKTEWVHREPGGGRIHDNRQDEHGCIEIDNISNELVIFEEALDPETIPPTRSGIPQSTVVARRLVNADEFSTVGAQYRTSLSTLHRHSTNMALELLGGAASLQSLTIISRTRNPDRFSAWILPARRILGARPHNESDDDSLNTIQLYQILQFP